MDIQNILLCVNGLLLSIVVYFAKSVVSQITKTSMALIGLDKSVSLLSQKMDNHSTQFKHFYKFEEDIERDVKELRTAINKLSMSVNNVEVKCDTAACTLKGKK